MENDDYLQNCKDCQTQLFEDLSRATFLNTTSSGFGFSRQINIPGAVLGTKELSNRLKLKDIIIFVIVFLVIVLISYFFLLKPFFIRMHR